MVSLYCLKCRKKQKCEDLHLKSGTNPKTGKKYHMLKGLCSACGTKCNQFKTEADYMKLKKQM